MKPIVSFEEFSKMDIRTGRVIESVKKDGSDKLLRLIVDFGEEGTRNILAGISQWYKPEDLIGKDFVFIINLEPRKIMGEESQGMLLAADPDSIGADGKKPNPLKPKSKVPPGSKIR